MCVREGVYRVCDVLGSCLLNEWMNYSLGLAT
jgi:hypothetical protein